MKELILICAVAVVFALCFLLLKKLDIFFGDSSRTVISSDRPSMLSIAFEHTEEVSLLNDLLEKVFPTGSRLRAEPFFMALQRISRSS